MGQKLSRAVLINDCNEDGEQLTKKLKTQPSRIKFLCRDLRSRLTIVVICTLLLGLIFPIACLQIIYSLLIPPHYTCSINARDRVPCVLPGINSTRGGCENAGCCWNDNAVGTREPACYHTRPSRYDYVVTSSRTMSANRTVLNMAPRTDNNKDAKVTAFDKRMLNMVLTVDHVTNNYVRIRAIAEGSDDVDSLWPDVVPSDVGRPMYVVDHSSPGDRFVLKIFRDWDMKNPILSMDGGPLVMTDEFVEFTIRTPTTNVYGLGQSSHAKLKHNMTWESEQLFARSGLNSGSPNGSLAYGVHPMYVCVEHDGNTHGVLLGLSQLTDVSLQPRPSITFRSSGRLIDIHVFMGPTPKDVVRQTTGMIGKPSLPPPWALGYHTCRSYGNVSVAQKVAEDLLLQGIPHESDCGDSRLMRFLGHSDSALSQLHFISDILKKSSLKLILYQGPQILNSTQISKTDVFIKDPSASGQPYYGRADDKDVVYPDFTSNDFNVWFSEAFQQLQNDLLTNEIDVHGLFLVDNTPLDVPISASKPCRGNKFQLPPVGQCLKDMYREADDTVCLNAIQTNGTSAHYAHHNTYGHTHLKSVSDVINNTSTNNMITLLASLSTFIGSGHYGGHWGGEYPTNWDTLKNSLIHLMEFNLYGIPLVGVPICGFQGDIDGATPQSSTIADFSPGLCWRWMQLGSLYPLALTYYGPKEKPREPNFFSKDFQTMTIKVLQLRYSLFPYVYTQFYYSHIEGDPVMRPLFYEFPKDKVALDIDEQFLLGSALMVVPTLRPFPSQVEVYFPIGCWYEFQTHFRLCFDDSGSHQTLIPSIHLPNIYIRGGSVIFQQLPTGVTLDETRRSNFTVTLALDGDAKASGNLVIGDVTIGMTVVRFEVTNNTFRSSCLEDYNHPFADVSSTTVDTLFVLGILQKPEVVTMNFNVNITSSIVYDEDTHAMKFSGIGFDVTSNFTIITWS